MLRDPSLVPLSRQPQHALALCVRLRRAPLTTPRELHAWQAEIEQHFVIEIRHHFAAEEAYIFPRARALAELSPLVDELIAEHAELRAAFCQATARALDAAGLPKRSQRIFGKRKVCCLRECSRSSPPTISARSARRSPRPWPACPNSASRLPNRPWRVPARRGRGGAGSRRPRISPGSARARNDWCRADRP